MCDDAQDGNGNGTNGVGVVTAELHSPPFVPMSALPSSWGSVTGEEISHSITCAYDEIVTWKRNIFRVPSGAVGKKFVSELSLLCRFFRS